MNLNNFTDYHHRIRPFWDQEKPNQKQDRSVDMKLFSAVYFASLGIRSLGTFLVFDIECCLQEAKSTRRECGHGSDASAFELIPEG